IGSNDRVARCIDAQSGKERWGTILDGDIKMSFASYPAKDLAVVGTMNGTIYFLSLKDGSVVHTEQTGDGIYSTPVIDHSCVYVSTLDKCLYCFDLNTFRLLWKFRTNGRLYAEPLIIGDSLYVGSCDGRLYELNKHTGRMVSFRQ